MLSDGVAGQGSGTADRKSNADETARILHLTNRCASTHRGEMPHDTSRRCFLASLGEAGVCLAAGSWLDVIGYAQASIEPAAVLKRERR